MSLYDCRQSKGRAEKINDDKVTSCFKLETRYHYRSVLLSTSHFMPYTLTLLTTTLLLLILLPPTLPMSLSLPPLKFTSPPPSALLPSITTLELSSYPSSEAATPQSLSHRLTHAPTHFLTCTTPSSTLAGFICGTRCSAFTADTMTAHDPDGNILAIHSVCVAPEFRRRGVASRMLKHYLRTCVGSVTSVRLLAKQNLLSLYTKAGFKIDGVSPIVHGDDPWFDLSLSTSPTYEIHNSFTTTLGSGNPCAIVKLTLHMPAPSMQRYAAEFNLSETAYVSGPDEEGVYDIRYFTPTTEIALCGHATLAAANVIGEENVTFRTGREGLLLECKVGGGGVTMDFPEKSAREVDLKQVEDVISALGVAPVSAHVTDDVEGGGGFFNVMLVVEPEEFKRIDPDFGMLKGADSYTHGVIVTCLAATAADGFDFKSRYFAPKIGIREDPVTGSAHCTLAPFWARKLGRGELVGWQVRGGAGFFLKREKRINRVREGRKRQRAIMPMGGR